MRTALLISTYNWPESLQLVLKSALAQTILPTEILLADDGSGKETQLLIEQFQQTSKIPIRHFWQEDLGFRKSKILNKTLAETKAEYIIQVDGDCIMHPSFVSDHINNAKKGVYLYGSRVNIVEQAVEGIFKKRKINFNFLSKEIKNKTRSLHIPFLSKLYKAHKGISSGASFIHDGKTPTRSPAILALAS